MKDLKTAGIPIKHLQRYLHARRCKYCEANLGRSSYYCKSAKQSGGDELILSTIVDPISPHMHITQTLVNEHEVTSAPPEGTALRPFKSVMEQGSDDQLIADQLQTHVITRSQSQAAERAKQNDLILSATPQQADAKHSSRKGAKPALASKPIPAAKDCIDIPMSEMPELSLADAFVTGHSMGGIS